MTDERSMRDRMLAGDAYTADDPDLLGVWLGGGVVAVGNPARVVREIAP